MAPKMASCPRPETLDGFLSGDLSLDQLARIEAHLAQCDSCGETLRATDVDDTLLRLARQASRLEDSDTEYLGRLIHRFRKLPANTTLASAAAIDSANARSEEILARLAPAKDDDELGRLAHYRILGLLGAGGMGVVFQAEDTRLRRLVALKVLRPSMGYIARQRFVQEARAVAAIDHDHVITIYEVGEEGSLAYIAMPWLAGETLEQRLQRESLLDTVEVTSIGQQVARGLAAAHARGVVHRDVKPANIWLEAGRDRAWRSSMAAGGDTLQTQNMGRKEYSVLSC